jgi:outer membrane protein assembly factor BamD
MRKPALPLLLVFAFFLSGCGVIDHFYLPVPDDTVQEIFEAGNDAMREKEYGKAAQYYARVKDDYPFSPYAVEAELSLGDAYFLDREYASAVDAYRDFETLHPRHEAIPYALFQLGLSLRLGYVSVDRAATDVEEALQYFTRIIQAYPTTEYAQKARDEIVLCRTLLARREVFIADVFWSMGNYQAAWTRYEFVRANYPDIADVSEYARQKGESAYLRHRENASEEVRRKREGSWRSMLNWL